MGLFNAYAYKAVYNTDSKGKKILINEDYYQNMQEGTPIKGANSTACFNKNNDSSKNGTHTFDIIDNTHNDPNICCCAKFISASIHENDYHNLCDGYSIKLNVANKLTSNNQISTEIYIHPVLT